MGPAAERRAGPAGAPTPAVALLDRLGFAYRLMAYGHDPAAASYGREAADALGLAPELVHKTLVADVDDHLVVAVVPVSGELDMKALAALRRAKRAALAPAPAAERATGYVVGGISPLGHRRALPVVVDAGALHLARVYVSAGRRGLELELEPAVLVAASGATVAVIAR